MQDGRKDDVGEVVLVTGGNGFIASHILSQLLSATDCPKQLRRHPLSVRATVRDISNRNKVDAVRGLQTSTGGDVTANVGAAGGTSSVNLEVVEADLLKEETWPSAVRGCTLVIHTASPFPVEKNPVDGETMVVKPAVTGTINVLRACARPDGASVRRVVLTSSSTAMCTANAATSKEPGYKYSESDWTDPESALAYARSKTLAERAAWNFIKEREERGERTFELVVLNPVLVMGPLLTPSPCTSMELIKRLLLKQMPLVPHLNFEVIDVRDVARAHLVALTSQQAVGNRHILCNRNIWLKDIALMLSKEFRPQGYSVPTTDCPYFLMWAIGIFDSSVKQLLPSVGKETFMDNTRMREILKIVPLDIKNTVLDMAYSLVEHGFVKKTPGFKNLRRSNYHIPEPLPPQAVDEEAVEVTAETIRTSPSDSGKVEDVHVQAGVSAE